MLPVFVDDPEITFWVPGNEFSGMDIFPEKRTVYFATGESLDLGGGTRMNTMEVPGHTKHSTLFFLEGKDLVFTGDAIGSGSGVWLFNEESFYTYDRSIEELIVYMENPDNGVNTESLRIYGGHYWQGKDKGILGAAYIYDMRKLIEAMKVGKADAEDMSAAIPFLDTNFKYGTATITWNRKAAEKLVNRSE
jgi:glyoxylase-like metal-dependent hydrolase (beta-lactamase superfamily II)